MTELMYKDNHCKAKPDGRNKLKAGEKEGSDRSRPMHTNWNATPMSKGKIAILPHCGIEPYFRDQTNRYGEFGIGKKFGVWNCSVRSPRKNLVTLHCPPTP